MATPTPPPSPLDAAIAKLRSEGRTDKEIADILRTPSASSPQPSQPTGAGVQGPMTPMTGVLGNASAVLSHAKGTIPVLKADLANFRDSTAPTKTRRISALKLAGAAVVIVALGYAIYQEWQIHIVYAPITAEQQSIEARAKAATAAEAARGGNTPIKNEDDIGGMIGGPPPPLSGDRRRRRNLSFVVKIRRPAHGNAHRHQG